MGTSFYNKILKILAAWSATEGSEINMATLLQMQMGSIPWEASKMDVHWVQSIGPVVDSISREIPN